MINFNIKSNLFNTFIVFVVGLLVLVTPVRGQQSIQYTQYIFNSMSVNPAYTGYKEEWFAQMALRSQWVDLDGAPKTGSVSIDGVLDPENRRHGVGLQVNADKLGAQSATSIYANYALRLQLDQDDTKRLSLGIGGGFTQYGLDGNKLQAVHPDDPNIPIGNINTWKPDIRLGVYYYQHNWYAGVALQDLLASANSDTDYIFDQTTIESIRHKRSMYVIGGMLFAPSEGLHVRPSVLIKDDFEGPTSLDVNAMLIFQGRFWIGGGYRTRARIFDREYNKTTAAKLSSTNSLSAIAQFYVTDNLRIGYSYDHALGKMSSIQNGTHEVTLGYTFGSRILQNIMNPRFF